LTSAFRAAFLVLAAAVLCGGCAASSAEGRERGRAEPAAGGRDDLLAEPLDPVVPESRRTEQGGLLSAPLDPPPSRSGRR